MQYISLTQITIEELQNLIRKSVRAELQLQDKEALNPTMVRGYQGLANYLKCSKTKAYYLIKSGQIDGAISQSGRTILIDTHRVKQILNK